MQVHSTIENAILPGSTQYGSSDDVLSWLDTTLSAIWVDPVCGDGVCETPFEYASYGRFGCRADCGKLSEIQNLTTLQIDLYFDFTHPTTSIASSVSQCPRLITGFHHYGKSHVCERQQLEESMSTVTAVVLSQL